MKLITLPLLTSALTFSNALPSSSKFWDNPLPDGISNENARKIKEMIAQYCQDGAYTGLENRPDGGAYFKDLRADGDAGRAVHYDKICVLHAMLTEDGVELNSDTNPDLPARHKRPVFTAVWDNIWGNEDILKYLIWMGSDLVSPSYSEAANECESSSTSAYSPNRKCYNNTLTPLMYGVVARQLTSVKLLLENGAAASINVQSKRSSILDFDPDTRLGGKITKRFAVPGDDEYEVGFTALDYIQRSIRVGDRYFQNPYNGRWYDLMRSMKKIEKLLIENGAKKSSELPPFPEHENYVRNTQLLLQQATFKDQNCIDILRLINSGGDSEATFSEIDEKSKILGSNLNTVKCDRDEEKTLLQITVGDLKLLRSDYRTGYTMQSGRGAGFYPDYDAILESHKRDYKIAEILMKNGAKPDRKSIGSVLHRCPVQPDLINETPENITMIKSQVSEIETEIVEFLNVMGRFGADFENDASFYDTSFYACTKSAKFLIDQGKEVRSYDVRNAERNTKDGGNMADGTARYQIYYELLKKTSRQRRR